MSFRKLFMTGALALAVSAITPAKASADWLFTPFIGSNFGGSADLGTPGEDFNDEFNRKLTYGASFEWMGGGIVGFGVDFGYSPNFFGITDSNGIDLVGDGNVTTLMGNVIVGAPLGAVRPYASGGLGMIKTHVDNAGQFFDMNRSDLGFDVGAGVMGFFNDNVGLRGDIRYFRAVNDNSGSDSIDVSLGSFKFWRGTVGVTFKF
jgi:opacity protein-like surface antigen